MKRLVSLVLLCLLPSSALANSSTAGFSNEGLKLLKSEKIRMASEDLFVSAERIRVRYTFENLTSQPIQTRVAFPFPAMDVREEEEGGDVSTVSEFTLTLGGKRQETRRESVYTALDKRLESYKSADAPPKDVLSTCVNGLKKTSPVRFELTREDFRPGQDLQLIFFQ